MEQLFSIKIISSSITSSHRSGTERSDPFSVHRVDTLFACFFRSPGKEANRMAGPDLAVSHLLCAAVVDGVVRPLAYNLKGKMRSGNGG